MTFNFSADGKYEVSYKSNILISSDGMALWIPPAIYKSSCTIDVEYFPFDEQLCVMKFGSWTFNAEQVILGWYSGDFVDLSAYANSGTWDIISCPGQIVEQFDVDNLKQVFIEFKIKIRRKTLFFTVNLIIPCVLISFLSSCVFYLPADAGEKMTMCISVLLALVVFMLVVSKLLPPTSIKIPLIAKYLLFTFIMNISTILITVFLLSWNFRTPRTHRMPKTVRAIFLNYLPRLLFMKRPHHDKKAAQNMQQKMNQQVRYLFALNHNSNNVHNHVHVQQTQTLLPSQSSPDNSMLHHPKCITHRLNRQKPPEDTESGVKLSAEAHKAIEAVRFIAAHLKNEEDYSEVIQSQLPY